MKKRLLIVLLICSGGIGITQEYIPMLQEGNVWSLHYGDGLSGTEGSAFYYFSGEEIINGETYKILYRDDIEQSCRFREENGILFAYNPDTNLDEPRLDFTLEIGDTFDAETVFFTDFCFEGTTNLYDYLEVTAIATEFIADEDRKVLTMSSIANGNSIGFDQYWIEGIGSTIGGFGQGIITFEILTQLMCFERNGVITFFNSFDECEVDLSVESFNLEDIKLYPNPVTHVSVLAFPSEGLADTVKIFDVQGILVKEFQVTSDYLRLSAMEFPSGLYFYQIYSEKQLLKTEKFIVK